MNSNQTKLSDCRTRKAVGDEDSDLGARIATLLGSYLTADQRLECAEVFPEFEEVATGRRIPGCSYLGAVFRRCGIDHNHPVLDELLEQEVDMCTRGREATVEVTFTIRVPLIDAACYYAPTRDWPQPEEIALAIQEDVGLWEFLTDEDTTVAVEPSLPCDVKIGWKAEPNDGATE